MSSLLLASPSPTLKLIPQTQPSLLPFHISYTGPAPISTYFLVKRVANETKRVFKSAFRGRELQGLEVDLPKGYAGLAVHVDAAGGESQTATNSLKRGREASSPVKASKRAKSGATSATGRKTRSSASCVEKTESVDEVSEVPSMMMMAADEEAVLGDEDTMEIDTITARHVQPVRMMDVVGRFDSILVWHPDMPFDEGRDEYARAMDEWTRLASVIHSV